MSGRQRSLSGALWPARLHAASGAGTCQYLVAAPRAWVVTWFCDVNAGGRLSDAVARACHLLCAADAAFGRKLNTR